MPFGHVSDSFLPKDTSTLIAYLAYGVPLALLLYSLFSPTSLRHVPTEGGPSLPLLSYKGTYNFVLNATDILQRGYDKHKGKAFKVAFTDRWLVVVTGKKLVDELQRLPDDVVSFSDAAGELTGIPYIFGHQLHENPGQVNIILAQLTKHLSPVFGDMYDEIATAFAEFISGHDEEWVPVHAIKVARNVVARTSNRVFVGLPICRDPDYLGLLVNFTLDIAKARKYIALLPSVAKPIAARTVAKMTTNIDRRIEEGTQYLGPLIEDRMKLMKNFGENWSDKPNDLLQWVIEEVATRNDPVEEVVRIILLVNFAAIHTSSTSFTHALYHLAASPEFIDSLREEIEAVIAEEGWTKAAMGKMWRLDSFMRENQRYNGINPISVMRKAVKSLTLSDGTFIPKDTILVAPSIATHFDNEYYKDSTIFDPFRYVREKEQDLSASKHQYVTTSADYVPFGHGRHACPGRFFAANELKAMMAHVIVNYDVKFEKEGVRPENVYTGLSIQPDPDAKVLFRRRKSSLV